MSAAMFVAAASALVFASGESYSAGPVPAGQSEPWKRQAIIVVRHGQDQDDCVEQAKHETVSATWGAPEIAPNWPTHSHLPTVKYGDGTTAKEPVVTTNMHCLSPIGEQQAKRLADELPGILDALNVAPVSRVIVIDPQITSPNWATANPFDTVLPFINRIQSSSKSIQSILLLRNNGGAFTGQMCEQLLTLTTSNALLDVDVGSTLVCWTGEGLNQTSGGHAALLERLAGGTITNEINRTNLPCRIGGTPDGGKSMGYESGKGNTLYIFTPRPFSAKTDGDGRIGGLAATNPNCKNQKYNLVVYQAKRKSSAPDQPANADFFLTHSYVVEEPSPTAIAGTPPKLVFTQPPSDPTLLLSY